MAWVRLEDNFYDNDKFEYVGPLGVALHVAALAYCNRNLTDGIIPRSKFVGLLNFEGIAIEGTDTNVVSLVVQSMVDAGLLHEPDHDCAGCPQPDLRKLVIHDYLRYQPSREKVERERNGSRERMAKSRRNRTRGSDDVAPQQEAKSGGSSTAPNPNPKTKEPNGSLGAAKRGSRLPDIYPITEEMREWGRENAPDVNASREHEKFCDYWRGVSGQRGVKRDWLATWRNWMRRAQDDIAPNRNDGDDDLPDWMRA